MMVTREEELYPREIKKRHGARQPRTYLQHSVLTRLATALNVREGYHEPMQ